MRNPGCGLTSQAATILHQSMDPFKIRVDWTCHDAYGDQVTVELHIMDREPKIIHRVLTPPQGAAWARRWLESRGFGFWCNLDWHQRCEHTHITLHPKPLDTFRKIV